MAVIDHITTNNSATYEIQDTVARIKSNNLESTNYTDIGGGFADGNTLLVKTDNGMKKGFLNNFANWILDKLATKVYNQLATSNKTMIGALNELNSNKTSRTLLELSDNIDDFLNKTSSPTAYFVWGTIGGLFGGWAWGVLICANGIANFIGIRNDNKTLAAAHYENGVWSKISTWS